MDSTKHSTFVQKWKDFADHPNASILSINQPVYAEKREGNVVLVAAVELRIMD